MGYRLRLGRIPKKNKSLYKGKTAKEIIGSDGGDIFNILHPQGYQELYGLGKYVNFKKGTRRFYDFDVYKETECEFYIMSKSGLKNIIDDYHQNTLSYFKEMLNDISSENDNSIERIKFYFKNKISEWDRPFGLNPYYLDEKITDGGIVKSWKMEYAIFNLIYIYRYFDWKNDYLIYSGW